MTDTMVTDPVDGDDYCGHDHQQVPIFEDRQNRIRKERRATITRLASVAVVVVVAAIVQHQQRLGLVRYPPSADSYDRTGSLDRTTMNEVAVDDLFDDQEIIFGLTVNDLKQTRRAQEERKHGRRARGSSRKGKNDSGKSSENVIVLDGGPAFVANKSAKDVAKSGKVSQSEKSNQGASPSSFSFKSEKSGKGKSKSKGKGKEDSPTASLAPTIEPSATRQPSSSSKKGGKGKNKGKKSKKGKTSFTVRETVRYEVSVDGIEAATPTTLQQFNSATQQFVEDFIETELADTVELFDNTIEDTTFIPNTRRLKEGSRYLMPADAGGTFVFNQEFVYQTTDGTLTTEELAAAPFETQQSRNTYVEEYLNSPENDENLRSITTVQNVIVTDVSTSPSPVDDSVAPTTEPSISSVPSGQGASNVPTFEPSVSSAPSTFDQSVSSITPSTPSSVPSLLDQSATPSSIVPSSIPESLFPSDSLIPSPEAPSFTVIPDSSAPSSGEPSFTLVPGSLVPSVGGPSFVPGSSSPTFSSSSLSACPTGQICIGTDPNSASFDEPDELACQTFCQSNSAGGCYQFFPSNVGGACYCGGSSCIDDALIVISACPSPQVPGIPSTLETGTYTDPTTCQTSLCGTSTQYCSFNPGEQYGCQLSTCRTPCTTNDDCDQSEPICDSGVCAECSVDADCTSNVCANGFCL